MEIRVVKLSFEPINKQNLGIVFAEDLTYKLFKSYLNDIFSPNKPKSHFYKGNSSFNIFPKSRFCLMKLTLRKDVQEFS